MQREVYDLYIERYTTYTKRGIRPMQREVYGLCKERYTTYTKRGIRPKQREVCDLHIEVYHLYNERFTTYAKRMHVRMFAAQTYTHDDDDGDDDGTDDKAARLGTEGRWKAGTRRGCCEQLAKIKHAAQAQILNMHMPFTNPGSAGW